MCRFVEPRFLGEAQGVSNDDHPFADIRNGEAFLNLVYTAVTQSPAWRNTVLVINFDEWGGFFEHVAPTAAPIPAADAAAGNLDGLRGFRVPCVIVSPWSRRGLRGGRCIRSHLGPKHDRVALEPATAHGSRCLCAESRVGSGLLDCGSRCAAVRSPARTIRDPLQFDHPNAVCRCV